MTTNNDAYQSTSELVSEHHESLVEGRTTRIRRPPTWMTDYETNMLVEEDDGLLAIMVERQRCVKNSMGSETWMKGWRQVLKALTSYGK